MRRFPALFLLLSRLGAHGFQPHPWSPSLAQQRMRQLSIILKVESNSKILERDHEKRVIAKGFTHVIGCDEAGRGALAGPVIAASVLVLPTHTHLIDGVNDSKKLSEHQRELIYNQMMADATLLTSFAAIDHKVIDDLNILQATMIAMKTCINSVIEKGLKSDPLQTSDKEKEKKIFFALIDGNQCPKDLEIHNAPVVKGDSKVYSIALASIVAKVERDRHMKEMSKHYPQYYFDEHKGYPTQKHVLAIHQHGACPIHRLSFKPLKGRQSPAPFSSSS